MTNRVLVTGATGFIGRHLLPALVASNYHVVAATRGKSPSPALPPEVEIVAVGDLNQNINWRPHLAGVDAVVHLAGIAHTEAPQAAESYDRVNRVATRDIARAARDLGARFIFISSVRAQTGATAAGTLSEDTAPEPSDAYGRSKLDAERDIAATGGRYVILRPVLVYGAGVGGNMGALVLLAQKSVPLPFGAIHNARSLLAVENLVAAILLALRSEEALAGTFLIADEPPVSLPEIIAHLRRGAGRSPGLLPVPRFLLGAAMHLAGREGQWQRLTGNLVVSTRRITALGYRPAIPTAQALATLGKGSA